ncbi:PAS domain-containing sensor histidine kinase [Natronorubrum sp. FCH18a]|uniref:PAS domain-containing sensor histidine kinase n=1 Tax=Natronorubrum sp. FCH18a TaxID=3447018 RepID=UPI003F5148DD
MTERSGATKTNFWADTEDDVALHRFQTLVNTIDDAIFQLDPAENFVAVNDTIVDATGYTRDELLGSHISLVLTEADVERIEDAIQSHVETDDVDLPTLELPVETADGETILCELRFNLFIEDGEFRGSVGVVREISHSARRKEREEKLTQYENIVETVEDGIYVLDDEYQFSTVNQAYVDMTGYSREELLGSHCSLVAEDTASLEAAEQSLHSTRTAEDVATIEAAIVRKDGTRLPAESKFTPLVSNDNGHEGTIGVVRDISERKDREQELRKYETIFETVEDGIYVVDEDGRFTMVNESYADMLGYAAEELVGSHALTVVDEDVHRVAQEMEAGITEGEVDTPSMEAEIRTADGEQFSAEATFAVLPAQGGGRERVGVVRDISERKERERALEESEQRYRTLIDHFPGTVGLYNEEFEYTLVGGEMLDALDISRDEVIGSSIYERYPDELVERIEPHFQAVFEGESHTFEDRYLGLDLWAHTLPVRNSNGNIFAGMLMVQDISERKEYRRKIEESNERLEQFAYAASHDLQEPLRMISSYLQLVDNRYSDELDEDGQEFIAFAVDGAERMKQMIEGLLQYSRVETQGDSFEPVDLDSVFENALEDLRVKIEENDADITAEPLPRVHGDAGQLRQVFQNLLSNAITYSGDEPPRVHVSVEENAGNWVFSVRDEGIGIDPDDRERIFEVFHRLHTIEEHSGTGIGLALCQRIVERHGGDIWVDSEPGDGATFSFTLPLDE